MRTKSHFLKLTVFVLLVCVGMIAVAACDTNGTGTGDGSDLNQTPTPSVEYTVTFLDYNGTVLKTETVKAGASATAPSIPSRTSYTFNGWSASFENVSSDMTVMATYRVSTEDPVLQIEDVIVDKEASIAIVNVNILNNPGLSSFAVNISFDDDIKLTSYTVGSSFSAFAALTTMPTSMPASGTLKFSSLAPLNAETANGLYLTLTFDISNLQASSVVISASGAGAYDILDASGNDAVTFEWLNGTITVLN